MPMKSQAQRKLLHAKDPALAQRFEKETPKGKALPPKLPRHSKTNMPTFKTAPGTTAARQVRPATAAMLKDRTAKQKQDDGRRIGPSAADLEALKKRTAKQKATADKTMSKADRARARAKVMRVTRRGSRTLRKRLAKRDGK